jgi:protein-S-isoprenylcysteine O-methyltransferase Ste14
LYTAIYLLFTLLLLSMAFLVFNHLVARDYLNKGRLGWYAALMQFLVFAGFFVFPYVYLPMEWSWDWLPNGTWNRLLALVLISLGMLLAFGTMLWFGLRRAFGLKVEGIVKLGPYRFSRNPQMLGGWLIVLGVFLYYPSLYNLGWVLMWALIGNWMVNQEEIHLHRLFGEEYEIYCAETPRYLFCK